MPSKRLLAFDPYRLDVQERRLLRGTEAVSLPPRLFDLLALLVQNAGSLLRKQDLLERVWSDVSVEEGSLTRGISSLRRVLGSSGEGRDFIQTVSKRGYRFAAIVRETASDEVDSWRPPDRLPLPPSLVDTPAIEFVGRENELAQLQNLWERARQGRHQVLLIAGEPGIGKTRLALEFARARAAGGDTVLDRKSVV